MADLSSDQSLELAGHLVAMGDLAGALDRCQEILADEPGHAGARRMTAALQCRTGQIAAYRINLDKRADRMDECFANEAEFGYPSGFIKRLSAVADADYGAVGCGKSHIAALTDCFTRTDSPLCMVLEDDFNFAQPVETMIEALEIIRQSGVEWDVLLLMGGGVVPIGQPQPVPFLLQVFRSALTAGYIVKRSYIPKLLACFYDSVTLLERYRGFQPRKDLISMRFPIDMSWLELQRKDRWFIFNPTFGYPRPGFSDIANEFQDYSGAIFKSWP